MSWNLNSLAENDYPALESQISCRGGGGYVVQHLGIPPRSPKALPKHTPEPCPDSMSQNLQGDLGSLVSKSFPGDSGIISGVEIENGCFYPKCCSLPNKILWPRRNQQLERLVVQPVSGPFQWQVTHYLVGWPYFILSPFFFFF